MRISSLHIFNVATNSLAKTNEALTRTQEQLSSGQRVNRPSDDPVAATKIMSLNSELASIVQYNKNIDIAENNLVLEESILGGVNNLIQRIQELAIQAGNTATLTDSEYNGLASEVDARLAELQNLLNTQNANGDFIFGGYKSRTAPFVGSENSGFRYVGDEGQQFIRIANNTTVASSDSGKDIFVDIENAENTVTTYASPANTSTPPVQISVGRVVDQEIYDDFYPEDMIITFNSDANISPPGKNFTATERSTGRVIAADQAYLPGTTIELEGVSFRISGSPVSGLPATESTLIFGGAADDFTPPLDDTFQIRVAGRTETFVLDANITSSADLATVLNSAANGNAARIASLGITIDDIGIRMPEGLEISISGGSARTDAVTGLATNGGVSSQDGVVAQPGDRLFIDSTRKQDILTTLARFSEAMKNFDGSSDSVQSLEDTVASTLTNLNNAQTSVLEIVSGLGARFNTLESTSSLHADSELVTKKVLGELRDIDYAEAATRLSAQSLILQAAQSSFVRVSQLSLINQL